MTRKTALAAASTVALAAALFGVAAPSGSASALRVDTNPDNCTAVEYNAVHVGMTRRQVNQIWDSAGIQIWNPNMAGFYDYKYVYGLKSRHQCSARYERSPYDFKLHVTQKFYSEPGTGW